MPENEYLGLIVLYIQIWDQSNKDPCQFQNRKDLLPKKDLCRRKKTEKRKTAIQKSYSAKEKVRFPIGHLKMFWTNYRKSFTLLQNTIPRMLLIWTTGDNEYS